MQLFYSEELLGRQHLNQMIKINDISCKTYECHVLSEMIGGDKLPQYSSSQVLYLSLIMRKTKDKPKLRDILLISFTLNVRVLKGHIVVQSLSCVQLCANQGMQHARIPCPSLSPGVCSNSCPLPDDAIQIPHPLLPPSPAFNLSQHQGLFQ